ncbi:FtsK/SpoIIIE family DNA translocase [Brevibacillus laterosporus]|uniref:FtsK/SpoIIIE family DNA translocase n=1 Tax=Brevibacillus laterosporus TaxID=1465 RepID=UPI0018F8958E|nr:DNA translocase FtsK [Brevibacillus laterosporus]MBG9775467.1 cell division protein FtsK [Brevibacillus laterosporus]
MSRRKRKTSPSAWASIIKLELIGLIMICLSVIGLLESGWLGQKVLSFLFRMFAGSWDFLIPVALIVISVYMMFVRKLPRMSPRMFGFFIIFMGILLWDHLLLYELLSGSGRFDQNIIQLTWERIIEDQKQKVSTVSVGGGMIGAVLFTVTNALIGKVGTGLVVGLFFLIGIMFIFQLSYVDLFNVIRGKLSAGYIKTKQSVKESMQLLQEEKEKKKSEEKVGNGSNLEHASAIEAPSPLIVDNNTPWEEKTENEQAIVSPVIRDFTERVEDTLPEQDIVNPPQKVETSAKITVKTKAHSQGEDMPDVTVNFQTEDSQLESTYIIPDLSMLSRPKNTAQQKDVDHASNAAKLVQTLKSFGVNAIVSEIHRGPAVTRYEVQPATGVKVSRIVSLTDDLALALAAKDIRIEAPIPGKSAIGIEVPNSEISLVTLREVLESPQCKESEAKLTVALGRDISGEPIFADLAKMPHLLVAGATGSGKSVCVNGIIMSILLRAKPNEVKLMMIDPKMVELNVYNGIPHLLAPVVTDPKRASVALKKVVVEMERRYNLFSKSNCRNIEMYNQMVKTAEQGQQTAPLPYIVVIVDELADLMMVAPGEVEDAICRLAQMARAAGIHLLIATQRPSVDVITGVIKANIPSRIAFGVSSMADSRTILDMGGAEKLLGRGDMLFLPMGASKPTRVQGAFVGDKEVEEVVSFVKEQQEAKYSEEMIPEEISEEPQMVMDDEMYEQAVQVVAEAQTASASLLQRRLRVGYTRAARLIDMMEAQGIVGPYEGSKPREVRIPRPSTETQIS